MKKKLFGNTCLSTTTGTRCQSTTQLAFWSKTMERSSSDDIAPIRKLLDDNGLLYIDWHTGYVLVQRAEADEGVSDRL